VLLCEYVKGIGGNEGGGPFGLTVAGGRLTIKQHYQTMAVQWW
jgi:hypothetical protein